MSMYIAGFFWGNKAKDTQLLSKVEFILNQKGGCSPHLFSTESLDVFVEKSSCSQISVFSSNCSLFIGDAIHKAQNKSLTFNDYMIINCKTNEYLSNTYWGNYLLFNEDPLTRKVFITRSPSGQLPLFYLEIEHGVFLFSSEIAILYEVTQTIKSLNWNYLLAFLSKGEHLTEETPFNGIKELLPGTELLLQTNKISKRLIWNPLQFLGKDGEEENNLENHIVDTVSRVIEGATRTSKGVLLDFSGGLDSSILLLCLANAQKENKPLKAINYFHPSVYWSNELFHARAVSKETGVDLIEFDLSEALPLTLLENFTFKPNKPSPALIYQKQEHDIGEIARIHNLDLFISGHGGDHAFLSPPPLEMLSDWIIDHGFEGLYQELKDLSVHHRSRFFQGLNVTYKNLFSYYCLKINISKTEAYLKAPWMQKKIRKAASSPASFPFNFIEGRIKPGKHKHLLYIYSALSSIDLNIRDKNRRIFNPLLSQPVLELVLSENSYNFFTNGYDRFPVRKAFGDFFKTKSVWRSEKGETSGVFQLGLKKNFELAKNLCLEGEFANHNYINKTILYHSLKNIKGGDKSSQWPLINLLSLELFLNYWKD